MPRAPSAANPEHVAKCKLTRDDAEMVRCVEQKIYDPCEWGGGPSSWIHAQCARAHAAAAERRVDKAEAEIATRLRRADRPVVAAKFETTQSDWRSLVQRYCALVNDVARSGAFGEDPDYLSFGFCLRRHYEHRAAELEGYLE
jgi:hypothetical protein